MGGPSVASTAPVLKDIAQALQQKHNRSQPSPPRPPPTTPQKPCQPSTPAPACKPQHAHCSSPPSAFRPPPSTFSSSTPNRRLSTTTQTTSSATTQPPTDAFAQWMDTVIPLAHSAPADEPAEDDTPEEAEQTVDEDSLQPYVAINPALLHDSRWAYRDLQLLCQRLGLGGRGDRTHLIHKLRTWNRTHFSSTTTQPNTAASNFALLCIAHTGGDGGGGGGGRCGGVFAGQLTPLRVRTPRLCDGSPRSALSGGRGGGGVVSEGRRLSFSVFNGVKIIPPRALQYDEDDDENEEADEEADEEAVVEQKAPVQEVRESTMSKGAAMAAACRDACKSATCNESQAPLCATNAKEASGEHSEQSVVKGQAERQKVSRGSKGECVVSEVSSLLLRRSARKRIPSRKVRDSQS